MRTIVLELALEFHVENDNDADDLMDVLFKQVGNGDTEPFSIALLDGKTVKPFMVSHNINSYKGKIVIPPYWQTDQYYDEDDMEEEGIF